MSTVLMILAIIYFVVIPSFKDRVVPVKKLLITPAIFMYLFYQTINKNFHVQFTNNWIIFLGIMTGILIGLFMRRNTLVKSDKNQQLIGLPGNYFSLIIFTLIFSIQFTIGYLQSVSPNYLLQPSLSGQIILFLISCASSIIIGANALLYVKYLAGASTTLELTKKRA